MHFLLLYEFVPEYLEQRPRYRSAHLKLAWEAQARGELVLAGAFGEVPAGAALLFRCDSPAVPRSFAEADPYVRNGLVVRWQVRAWNTVVGAEASQPVRPGD